MGLAEIFKGATEGLLKQGTDLIESFVFSKEEKTQAKEKWAQMVQQHELDLNQQTIELERIWQEDRDSARKMQIEALRQKDWFSRNYLYLLATLLILSSLAFGTALMFYPIPETNRRTIEMFFDMFLFAGALTVVNFFFGSSKGSKDKTEILGKQAEKSLTSEIDQLTETRADKRERRRERREQEEEL